MKYTFSKINSAFFCPALFYSTLISTLVKAALKNFKRLMLVDRFDGFFFLLTFQNVSSKLVKEFEDTIWTV